MPDNNESTALDAKLRSVAARIGNVCNAIKSQADATDAALSTLQNTTMPAAISDAIATLKAELLGGAGTAYDTLKEIEDFLKAHDNVLSALQSASLVSYGEAQSLTDAQKTQARDNIGAAAAADLTALTTRVTTAEGDIDNIEAALGDLTNLDLVAVFNSAYQPAAQSGD